MDQNTFNILAGIASILGCILSIIGLSLSIGAIISVNTVKKNIFLNVKLPIDEIKQANDKLFDSYSGSFEVNDPKSYIFKDWANVIGLLESTLRYCPDHVKNDVKKTLKILNKKSNIKRDDVRNVMTNVNIIHLKLKNFKKEIEMGVQ